MVEEASAYLPDLPKWSDANKNLRALDKTLGKCIAILKVTLIRFDNTLESVAEENWIMRENAH